MTKRVFDLDFFPKSKRLYFLLLGITLLISLGCQKINLDQDLGPWSTTNWLMQKALDADFPLEDLEPYLSKEVKQEVALFRKEHPQVSPKHLISLTAYTPNQWQGRFLYTKQGWNLLLEVRIERVEEGEDWIITQLPDLNIYKTLTEFVQTDDIPIVHSFRKRWSGGLIGFDLSGRPLATISIVWTPNFLFINGVPIPWSTTPKQSQLRAFAEELESGFKIRTEMARSVQANYTPQVALVFDKSMSTHNVENLITWCEQSGTASISFIVQDEDENPTLLPLARRVPQLSIIQDQHFLHARLKKETLLFQNEETFNKKPKGEIKKWVLKGVHRTQEGEDSDEDLIRKSQRWFKKYYRKSHRKQKVSGMVIYPSTSSTYNTLVTAIDLARQVTSDLPVALATPSSSK